MKVPHNAVVHRHPAHPWVIASCIVFGLGVLAAAAFWIRKCKDKIAVLLRPRDKMMKFQTYKKEKDEEPNVIGHDRFYQERSRTRTKIKRVSRRSRSAADFSGNALEAAQRRAQFATEQSVSTEEKKNESLAKVLFSRKGGNSGVRSSSVPRHEYSALRLENGTERSNLDKQIRDGTFNTCQQYLANKGRYEVQCNLLNVGSRPDKQWFIVNDKSLGADRLLSLIEIPSCAPIKPTPTTRETLLELFRSLHHPYVHPILDVEFWDIGAAFISPLNVCGSLKDLIYGMSWRDNYDRKYVGRGEGLPYRQVQCLGRQILEALLFLHNRSFPKFYHLHSGNVIIQNGVARLAALENTLLGLPPKPPAVNDSLAFGYILFEMTAGYELPTPPSPAHLQIELERTPKIADALSLIFESSEEPSVEELLRNELFRGVELRELRRTTGITYTTSTDVTELLETVRASIAPIPPKSDVELLETRDLEEAVEEEMCSVENETLTVVIEER